MHTLRLLETRKVSRLAKPGVIFFKVLAVSTDNTVPSFFSSYQVIDGNWNYVMGGFAQQILPLRDSVSLTILRLNGTGPEEVVVSAAQDY